MRIRKVLAGLSAAVLLVVGLVSASYAGTSRDQIRTADAVRPPIHSLQGAVRVSERQMTFGEAMKLMGMPSDNTYGGIDLSRPVYVTQTRFSQPFQMGSRSYAAGTVTTVTDAATGFVHLVVGPAPTTPRSPLSSPAPQAGK